MPNFKITDLPGRCSKPFDWNLKTLNTTPVTTWSTEWSPRAVRRNRVPAKRPGTLYTGLT